MEGGGASPSEAESEAGAFAEAVVKALPSDASAGAVVLAEFDVFNVGCEKGAEVEGLSHRTWLSRGLFGGRRGCYPAG
jgi:hypothetical protein